MSKVYQIATIDSNNIPHVRSHVSRGILYPKGSPSLPILLTSTDIRTAKVTQMLSNSRVELAWWMEGSQEQFRVNGRAYIIPPPSHPFHTMQSFPPGSSLEKLTQRGADDSDYTTSEGGYDWEKKRREVFNAMSPGMKASWATPPPGTVLKSYDEANSWPSTLPRLEEADNDEDRKTLEYALGNFALVLIDPLEVDWVQLGIKPNRRTKFTRNESLGDGDEWTEEITIP